MNTRLFDWFDYTVFSVMLLLSALIGVYFGFFAKQKQNTTSEYLLGGKKMGVFPISMSLIASYVSGLALLGTPAEIYVFGTQFMTILFATLAVPVTMAVVYLPVFYTLQITSSYEYLKVRFSESVRLLGTVFFIIQMLLYIPVVIYVPALAFNQVTGVHLHLVTPIVCFVCVFYTSMGGLKAVVWTDTLQSILMFGGTFVVVVLGVIRTGGMTAVLEVSERGDRLEFFNMDPDPTIRHTFWSVTIGSYFNFLAVNTVNQAMVQRCLAMPSLGKAKITVMNMALGCTIITSICGFTGLVAYAYYVHCDPLTSRVIKKSEQILPYFVMEISESVPGLPGLFVAGVFSAALSTMSTGLNSMTGVIFQDLVRPVLKRPMSEARTSFFMKLLAAALGVVCTALVLVVEHLGALIQAVLSLTSVVSGPLLGLFSLGMLFPWANAKGALAGGVSSFLVVAWISFGTHLNVAKKLIRFPTKTFSIDGCGEEYLNITLPQEITERFDPSVWSIYRISYLWYGLIGVIITFIVGMSVSYMTGMNDVKDVDPDMLSPVIHRFLPSRPPHSPKELVALSSNHVETTDDHAHNQTTLNGRRPSEGKNQTSSKVGEDMTDETTTLNK